MNPERQMAVCRAHGLRYDRTSQDGCVICRREAGTPSSRPPSGRANAGSASARRLPSWIRLVVVGAVVGALVWWLAFPKNGDLYAYLEGYMEASQVDDPEAGMALARLKDVSRFGQQRGQEILDDARAAFVAARSTIDALAPPTGAEAFDSLSDQAWDLVAQMLDAVQQVVDLLPGVVPHDGLRLTSNDARRLRSIDARVQRLTHQLEALCVQMNTELERLRPLAEGPLRKLPEADFCKM